MNGPALKAADAVQSAATSEIDESTARQLLVTKYRHLFGDKYFVKLNEHDYRKLPALPVEAIKRAERTPDGWHLEAEGERGLIVSARVDLAGHWVDIDYVFFWME